MFLSTGHVHRLIVSASLALVVVLSTAQGQAQTAGLYELAFVHDGQIFKVRSDGTGLVQLTSGGVNSEPAWAPDGSRIAFVHSGASSGDSEIYVMNADGSTVVQRTNAGLYNSSPAWSPDGTRIAFSSVRDGQYRIYVMRVDQDWWNPAPLGFDRGWNGQPAWSPDGTKIAFVSDWRAFDILYDLYVMNADGSDMRLLLAGPFFPPGQTYEFQPAWSPDGGTIAVTVCTYAWDLCFPDSTLALVNADGSGLRSIASAGGYAHPSWSPDGTIIAFGSSACRECPSTIQYVTRDGSGSGVLVSDAHSPTWRPITGGRFASPDGTTVPAATQIIDNSGAIWTIGSNQAILRNGVQAAGGWGSKILWTSNTIYVLGTDSNWWQWTGSGWVNVGPLQP
jgi:Tol biopolymer transport system component